jgi:hypothetical protein
MRAYTRPDLLPGSLLGEDQASRDRPLVAGAPLLAVLSTASDTRRDWLIAGQALGRVLLCAAAAGAMAAFLNQPIQVGALRAELGELLGEATVPQLLLRLGFGHSVPATPRRPVEDVLREPEE